MRKPNQGKVSSSKNSSSRNDVTGPIVDVKIRPALNKVNEHPMEGAYMGFSTPKTIT